MNKNSLFVFWNPNPNQKFHKDGTPMKWKGTDCAIRSLARAMKWSWIDTYTYLFNISKSHYYVCNDMENLVLSYKSLNFIKGCSFDRNEKKPTVKEFAEKHKKGCYILHIAGHVVCLDNGKYYDTWDCGEWCVRSYYYKQEK